MAPAWKMIIATEVAQLMPVRRCTAAVFSLIVPSVLKVNPFKISLPQL
jgi:hypothetical protein